MRARVQAEPGVGVDAVELGGFDQGGGDGGGATAGLRADEEVDEMTISAWSRR